MEILLHHEVRNLMLVAQLTKLKELRIYWDRQTTALIRKLSVNTELEMLRIDYLEFNDDFLDALGNLQNLRDLRLNDIRFTLSSTSIKMLPQNLTKLESLSLTFTSDNTFYYNFPYQQFLTSLCKSDKFRSLYVYGDEENFYREVISKGIYNVSGNTLFIYLSEEMFHTFKEYLQMYKFDNIRILCAN